MNKHLIALGSALLISTSLPTWAASTVDLTVKGLITPSACTIDLPGVIDFGKISAKDLNQDSPTSLDKKTLQVTVACDAHTLFALHPVDNRAESSTNPNGFGLGLINDSEKLGRYFMLFANPVADIALEVLERFAGDQWAVVSPGDVVVPGSFIAFGNLSEAGWAPTPLKDVSVSLSILPSIAAAKNLTLTHEVALDGSATLEVKYL